MRLQSRRRPLVAALWLLPIAGCFEFKGIPDAAQISCDSTDENACPAGMECCENRRCVRKGDCRCRDGREYCELNGAIDCAGNRSCENGCWGGCPTCQALCTDRGYQRCRSSQFVETWFCPLQQVCLVKFGEPGSTATSACYTPPQQCDAQSARVCSCFNAPFSTVRPCFPAEHCLDLAASDAPCVGCSRVPTDAGNVHNPPLDGGFDEPSMVPGDASSPIQDAQSGERTPGLDSGAAVDGAIWDTMLMVDDRSGSPLDQGPRPAPDSLLLNQAARDGQEVGGINFGTGIVTSDWIGPLCYRSLGTNASNVVCCDMSLNSLAVMTDVGYRCASPNVAVTACGGFGTDCIENRPTGTGCPDATVCRWAWYDANSDLNCASTGPAAPCASGIWLCPAGSAPVNECINCIDGLCS